MRSASRRLRTTTFLAALLAGAAVSFAQNHATDADPFTAPPDLEELLARVRAAVGWEAFAASGKELVLRGSVDGYGTIAPLTFRYAGDGRFLEHEGGPVGRTINFDGNTVWRRQPDATVWRLDFGQREQACVRAWLLSGFWLDPRAPVEAEALDRPDPERPAVLIRALEGVTPMVLRIDPMTWLPSSLGTRATAFLKYQDHQRIAGLAVPRKVTFVGLPEFEVSYAIETVTAVPAGDGSAFEKSRDTPAGASFDEQAPAELETRRLPDGRLLVRATVEDLPVWLLFDTGAAKTVLSDRLADALELETTGEAPSVATTAHIRTNLRSGSHMRIGRLVFADPLFRTLDLPHLGERPQFDGVCGSDVFARAVVELDIAGGRVALFDPKSYELAAGEHWQGLRFDGVIPCLPASFEGDHTGWFRLDSGSTSTVTFHTPAVRTLGLLEGRRTRVGYALGAAGVSRERRGYLEWFEFGGRRFERPYVSFATGRGGALADPYTTGNIGAGFMSEFRLVFDYRNERMTFLAAR